MELWRRTTGRAASALRRVNARARAGRLGRIASAARTDTGRKVAIAIAVAGAGGTGTAFWLASAGAAPNNPPIMVGGASINYTENQAATLIDSTVTVGDPDTDPIAGATVQITGGFAAG